MIAQGGPIIDIPPWAQTSVALAVMLVFLGLFLTGRIMTGAARDRDVQALKDAHDAELNRIAAERQREREAMQNERDVYAIALAAANATGDTWKSAAGEQARAREAAERAAQNLAVSADVVQALVSAFQQATGRVGT